MKLCDLPNLKLRDLPDLNRKSTQSYATQSKDRREPQAIARKSIFSCEHSFRQARDKPASFLYRKIGVCIFGYEILPLQKARSALVYFTSIDLDSVEEGAPAQRRRTSSAGDHEVQKRCYYFTLLLILPPLLTIILCPIEI